MRALLALLCALSGIGFCRADEAWSLHPSLRLEGRHDDNVNLVPTSPKTETALRLSTVIGLLRSQPTSKINSVLGVDFINYSGSDAPPETSNQFVRFSGEHVGRRNKLQLDANFQRDTLLRTVEVPVGFDPDVPASDINVALTTVSVERHRLLFSPSWKYELTRRNLLQFDYDLTAERFDHTAGVNVVDYNRHVLAARLMHRISMNNVINANVRVTRFDAENLEPVDSYELLAGFSHSYSPVDTLAFEVGARRAEQTEADDSTGFVAGLSWRGRTSLATTLVKIERQLYPNGFGDLTETDQVIVQWIQRLSRATQLLTKGRAFDATPIDASSQNGRTYAQLDAELRHLVDRWWSAGLAYRYRWIDRESDQESSAGNGIFISIGYDKPLMVE